MVHGEEEAEKAQATARGLFSGARRHTRICPRTKLATPSLSRTVVIGLLDLPWSAAGLCGLQP